jgi:hypothetical protein
MLRPNSDRTLLKTHEVRGGLTFALPSSFRPEEFLTAAGLMGRRDDARYFVSTVLTKTAHGDVDGRGFVRLYAKYLRNIMYQATYNDVIDSLLEGGVVERRGYKAGKHSFGYRLTARFASDRHVRVPATDLRLIKRWTIFAEQKKREREAEWLPVHHALAEQQRRLRIHGDQARRWLSLNTDANKFDTQGVLVRDIELGRWRFNVQTYERVTNNISNLKRELRRFLHVDGEPLGQVDLKCCQYALIPKLLPSSTAPCSQREKGERGTGVSNYDASGQPPYPYDASALNPADRDVERYRTLAGNGMLYDVLLAEVRRRGEDIDRQELKHQLMRDVLAKRGNYRKHVVEQVFDEFFPTLRKFIRAYNHDGKQHENLSRQLQREEARLVIGTVADDLVTQFPGVFFLTLHDAIYTTVEHLPKVEAAFHRGFERIGLAMKFETLLPET